MNKKFFAPLLAVLLFCSCKNLQDTALDLANDGKVDKAGMSEFLNIVKDKTEPGDPIFYTNNKPDTAKAAAFIFNTCTDAGIKIKKEDIYTGAKTLAKSPVKFSFNVYLEDSESMDAYVNGNTSFKDGIYSLLGNVITDTLTSQINLYYINDQIRFSQENANAQVLIQFIQNLDPQTFRKNGGNRSSSDMRRLLGQVLDRTDDQHISLLVSDFVFSPGKHQNATAFLQQQSTGIKIALAQKMKNFDLAIDVLRLRSNFSGIYFDEYDHRIPLTANRPYYMWLIGSVKQLAAMRKSGALDNIKGGLDRSLLFIKADEPVLQAHKILYAHKSGDFDLPQGANSDISDARPDAQSNVFGFDVLVDFSKNIQDLSFFDDTANYLHDAGYHVTIKRVSGTTEAGFTHCLHLTTTNLQDQTLNIYTRNRIPAWVADCNSDNDQFIKTEPSQLEKTFGFQYLVQGVYDAFYRSPRQDKITQIQLTIKK